MPKGDNNKGKKIPRHTKPTPPPTNAEVETRVAQVANMIIGWAERFVIQAGMQEKYWLSTQTIDRYIASARVRIREKDDEEIEFKKQKAEQRYNYIYSKCVTNKKWDSALRATKGIVDLNWLEAPKKIALSWHIDTNALVWKWVEGLRGRISKSKK